MLLPCKKRLSSCSNSFDRLLSLAVRMGRLSIIRRLFLLVAHSRAIWWRLSSLLFSFSLKANLSDHCLASSALVGRVGRGQEGDSSGPHRLRRRQGDPRGLIRVRGQEGDPNGRVRRSCLVGNTGDGATSVGPPRTCVEVVNLT